MGNNDHLTPTLEDRRPSSLLRAATMTSLREEGEDFLLDLIDLFVTEAPTRLATLAAALAEGNHPVAQRAAHTLKSTAAIFGAEALEAVAAAAERAAQAGNMRELARLLTPLRAAAEQVQLVLLAERKMLLASHVA